MNYQDLFQCLKGVGDVNLSSLVLPVNETTYVLCPINCNFEYVDSSVIKMLTEARNKNPDSFLTFFNATPERTFQWITNSVAKDRSRILFSLKDTQSNEFYGYMGLAYGSSDGTRIEGDAIVRFKERLIPGLMRKAFLSLIDWAKFDIGIQEIWIRVLSDNPAIEFYRSCGFAVVSENPLYEIRNSSGKLEELSENPSINGAEKSIKTLIHMQHSYKI